METFKLLKRKKATNNRGNIDSPKMNTLGLSIISNSIKATLLFSFRFFAESIKATLQSISNKMPHRT